MDYGESESVVLYKELNANFLLVDDRKARKIAESLGINCIGTLGVLLTAKKRGLVKALRPLFKDLLDNNRYYALQLLNNLLVSHNELKIKD
jgi:predicted nucleic acid-binding protein